MNFSIWTMPSWEMAQVLLFESLEAAVLGDFLDIELDRGQGIADFVGDRRRQPPDRGELFGLDEFLLSYFHLPRAWPESCVVMALKLRARWPNSSWESIGIRCG